MFKREENYPFFVIGLDIGGTKIAGAILKYTSIGQAPEIVHKDKVAAKAKEGCAVFSANINNFALALKNKATEIDPLIPVVAAGMGCAGRINKISGDVITATDNFPGFAGYKLCKNVSNTIDLPAFALNDVQSHTLGEARWGAGKGIDNFILLAVGTGIGGCAIINGNLLLGSHGYAGEFGHVQTCLGHDISCTCGKSGHLEAVSSGSGIERIYKQKTGMDIPGPKISELANNGDKVATETIELAGRTLGQIIAMYLSVFDPEIIILSGSVSKSGEIWKNAVMAGFDEEVIEEISSNLNLCSAKLGDDAAFIGAAEYALDRLEDNE